GRTYRGRSQPISAVFLEDLFGGHRPSEGSRPRWARLRASARRDDLARGDQLSERRLRGSVLERPDLRHCHAIRRDDEALAGFHPTKDPTHVVAQLTNGHRVHERIVARVLRPLAYPRRRMPAWPMWRTPSGRT